MTAGERRVKKLAKSTSVPMMPVRPGKTYPLSPLDHMMAAHTVHLVFYYRAAAAMEGTVLKESLSEVLTHYPAMAGRLGSGEDGNWVVRCNDAGVRVVDAKAEVTLDRWLETATAEEEMDLAHWEPMGDDTSIWSPFYIQITEFEDKGYAIGLSFPHMHADPTCAIFFIKAWGDAHRRACILNPPFFHPPGLRSSRPVPNPSSPFLSLKSLSSSSSSSPMSSATFVFSDSSLKSLISDHQSSSCPEATPFSILAALFWSRIAGGTGSRALTVGTDFRKRMHAPLPHGFYGNAIHFSAVTAELGGGVGSVAERIRGHVEGMEEEEYWSAIEWVEERKTAEGTYLPAFTMYGPELTCVNLEHVSAYGAVFEKGDGGRAAHVTCRFGGVVGEGVVVVMPAPEEGMGRTVSVTLPEDLTVRICRDEVISRYEPLVMFEG
ncbi:hypothetical protein J5N97_016050 [Dioscorea zingiberensis]|uniref:Uncharacterized protein n=1 Tax=Dioscorea zingiberensis TaxID=325984 RepID=A0A9D5HF16_9LILI|nr:hypothetical protein J5N97_016050 [Dioscorea zingiberensis]